MLSNDNHAYRSIKGIFNTISLFKVQGCFWVVHVAQRVMREDTFPCSDSGIGQDIGCIGCYTHMSLVCANPATTADCFIIPRCHKACKYNQREQQASSNDGHFSSIFYSQNQTHLLFRHNSANVQHLGLQTIRIDDDYYHYFYFVFVFCRSLNCNSKYRPQLCVTNYQGLNLRA